MRSNSSRYYVVTYEKKNCRNNFDVIGENVEIHFHLHDNLLDNPRDDINAIVMTIAVMFPVGNRHDSKGTLIYGVRTVGVRYGFLVI